MQVLAEVLRVGGSYPWRLDEGDTTVLHLKNTIAQPVDALVQVRYAGGSYNAEGVVCAAFRLKVELHAFSFLSSLTCDPQISGSFQPASLICIL